MPKKKDELIGKVFHSFDPEHHLEWQGEVRTDLGNGFYLVLLHDWLVGMPWAHKVVHLSDMKGWNFYDDRDYWRDEGEKRMRFESRNASSDPETPEVLPSVPIS